MGNQGNFLALHVLNLRGETTEAGVVMDAKFERALWRVAIVEDHLLQRLRTEELLGAQPGLQIAHSCEAMPDLLDWLRSVERANWPHVLVLDLTADRRPGVDPVDVSTLVGEGIRVVVLSALASPVLVRDVIRAGARAVVSKRDREADIVAAIWAVIQQGEWMTPELAHVMASDPSRPQLSIQEERALILYASGLTLEAVAAAMGIRSVTAKQYIQRVKSKYTAVGRHVRTKLDLNRIAVTDGFLDSKHLETMPKYATDGFRTQQ